MFQLLRDNNIYVVTIPDNCTDKLQPMDLSVNKVLKNSMKQQFSEWYSSIVYKNFSDEIPPPVDLRMSITKPLGAQWIKNAFSHIKGNSTIIMNGFAAAAWNYSNFGINISLHVIQCIIIAINHFKNFVIILQIIVN